MKLSFSPSTRSHSPWVQVEIQNVQNEGVCLQRLGAEQEQQLEHELRLSLAEEVQHRHSSKDSMNQSSVEATLAPQQNSRFIDELSQLSCCRSMGCLVAALVVIPRSNSISLFDGVSSSPASSNVNTSECCLTIPCTSARTTIPDLPSRTYQSHFF